MDAMVSKDKHIEYHILEPTIAYFVKMRRWYTTNFDNHIPIVFMVMPQIPKR